MVGEGYVRRVTLIINDVWKVSREPALNPKQESVSQSTELHSDKRHKPL